MKYQHATLFLVSGFRVVFFLVFSIRVVFFVVFGFWFPVFGSLSFWFSVFGSFLLWVFGFRFRVVFFGFGFGFLVFGSFFLDILRTCFANGRFEVVFLFFSLLLVGLGFWCSFVWGRVVCGFSCGSILKVGFYAT